MLAALTIGLGAALAPAADRTPLIPKKPNNFSWGASNPTVVNKPHVSVGPAKKPNNFSWGASNPLGWSFGASNPTVLNKPENPTSGK
jgi:hypothetical protein